jgi:hypothetical protein
LRKVDEARIGTFNRAIGTCSRLYRDFERRWGDERRPHDDQRTHDAALASLSSLFLFAVLSFS